MTSPDDHLSHALNTLELPEELNHSTLMELFTRVTGLPDDSAAAGIFEDAFLAAMEQSPTALELRPGGWRVDVAATMLRTALTTSILTAALWLSGIDQIPAAVMPAVLPMLIVTERVRLNRREQYLLTQLQQNVGSAKGLAVHPDVLYNKLPLDVRDQLSPLDFQDFLDAFIATGHADDAGGGDVRVRDPHEPSWIRITFR